MRSMTCPYCGGTLKLGQISFVDSFKCLYCAQPIYIRRTYSTVPLLIIIVTMISIAYRLGIRGIALVAIGGPVSVALTFVVSFFSVVLSPPKLYKLEDPDGLDQYGPWSR